MNIHIIGICGTFMGGLAQLALELGHRVSGSDANTYPPMSVVLENSGAQLFEGFSPSHIAEDTDMVVIGNTIGRGNEELEHVLDSGRLYCSGPEWLYHNILRQKWVLAVAGTHGKTTTASILSWILDDNGYAPGFLIGGVAENFGQTARVGEGNFFVVEADEYDTAFSDKRSKFVHYHPRTLVINNLEFDHADIFADLDAIKHQFHQLIRTLPQSARIIYNEGYRAIKETLDMGCWSETETFATPNSNWTATADEGNANKARFSYSQTQHSCEWPLIGQHNIENACAAIAAAHHVGVQVEHAVASLPRFKSVKRRLETIFENRSITIYDDFAHHPTAIRATLEAVKRCSPDDAILAVLEPRSNTMKLGVHKDDLAAALALADHSLVYATGNIHWDVDKLKSETISVTRQSSSLEMTVLQNANNLLEHKNKLHIVIMSNGGFEGLHLRLIDELNKDASLR